MAKIFVGGLSWNTTEDTFANVFSRYGDIVDAIIMKDRNTGASRGFGFITFSDPSSVDKVIGQTIRIDGRAVECKIAVPPSETVPSTQVAPVSYSETKGTKVFIGGISWDTTDAGFTSFFSRFGEIKDAVVMRDRVTGASRGFGFVTFADPTSVDKVLAQEIKLEGRTLDVKVAIPRGHVQTRKLFVGGIPAKTTQQELRDYFSQYGGVVDALIMLDQESRPRGFGFVTFDSDKAVEAVLSKTHTFHDKQVECKRTIPKGKIEKASQSPLVARGPYGFDPYGDYSGYVPAAMDNGFGRGPRPPLPTHVTGAAPGAAPSAGFGPGYGFGGFSGYGGYGFGYAAPAPSPSFATPTATTFDSRTDFGTPASTGFKTGTVRSSVGTSFEQPQYATGLPSVTPSPYVASATPVSTLPAPSQYAATYQPRTGRVDRSFHPYAH